MDDAASSEDLPGRYRAVLDVVARLERIGERELAWRIRRDALHAYSTRWDEGGKRTLARLTRDGLRRLEARSGAAHGTLATMTEPA